MCGRTYPCKNISSYRLIALVCLVRIANASGRRHAVGYVPVPTSSNCDPPPDCADTRELREVAGYIVSSSKL
ncbi:hypothetical protein DFH09DRAFT_1159224, partial [Mycena vulgaris]